MGNLISGIQLSDSLKIIYSEKIDELINQEVNKRSFYKKFGYNLKEASDYLGISRPALKARIKRGTVRAYRDGNTYIIPVQEIERLYQSQ